MKIEQWVAHTDFEKLKANIGKRKLYIWGFYSDSIFLRELLVKKGLTVYGFIDDHIYDCSCEDEVIMRSKNVDITNSFIIVPLDGVRKEIMDYFNYWNLRRNEDFVYIDLEIPQIVICCLNNNYEDSYGNKIICNEPVDIRIKLVGYDNNIVLGAGIFSNNELEIICSFGSKIEIGDYFNSSQKVMIESLLNGTLILGDNIVCYGDSEIKSQGAFIKINNYCTFGNRFSCLAGYKSNLIIGRDMMGSHDVSIIASNMHELINLDCADKNEEKNTSIEIGNHVWIGKSATLLPNTRIGNDSIVGAASVCKGKYSEHSVICGNIAKVVSKNKTWSRRDITNHN